MAKIIENLEFGTNEIGTPQRTDGGGWERIDTWNDTKDGHSTRERRFAAGPDDHSPMARSYSDRGNCSYHPRCSCCWLGFSHTLALHQREAVGEW